MAGKTKTSIPLPEYDYVIAGGGTAGLVVARRLSADPDVSVLVLEAGTNHLDDPMVNIPAFWPNLMGSEVDWQFRSVGQPSLNGRTIKHPQGKLLGGSSGLNGQVIISSSRKGIDAWEKLGNPGWNWSSLSPYYRKFYTLCLPDEATQKEQNLEWIDQKVHGDRGPLQVSFQGASEDPLGKAWIDSFKNLGFGITADPFSGQSLGGYSNMRAGDPQTMTRSYSASAFFAPVSERSNLDVVTGAQATRILLEGQAPQLRATGVEALVGGSNHRVRARKEVIVSAGAFNSPKLLELSGIGNKTLLERHGIKCLYDNRNVGENLQDHVMTGISYEAKDGVVTGDPLLRQDSGAIEAAQKMYAEQKAGPFTAGGVASHAFMPLMQTKTKEGRVEQQKLLDRYPATNAKDKLFHSVVRDIVEDPEESSAAWWMFACQVDVHDTSEKFSGGKLLPGNFITLGANFCHPFSRGSTHICSADPAQKPEIDPKYFENPLDLELLARHYQDIERLAETSPLTDMLVPNGQRNHPTAYVKELASAKKYLVETGLSNWHPCGANAMLPFEQGGVVDHKLKVYGTSNVRVVDASIIPLIPRGNIMSTVYAVAERASDIIKGRA